MKMGKEPFYGTDVDLDDPIRQRRAVHGVPLAAGVLYPVFGVLLSPMITSAAPWALVLLLGGCTGGAADGVADLTDDTGPVAVGDTWDTFGAGFFDAYCVACHDASPRDFRSPEDVAANADAIRCGVATTALDGCGDWPPPEQFPVGTGPQPTDDERDRIVAWIDAGQP